MSELTERAWKHRFSELLSRAFVAGGIDPTDALEDAFAHADHQYPKRSAGTPEHDARAVYGALKDENPA